MTIHEQLLEKWQQCREKRYPVLFIITAPLDTLFPPELVKNFADASEAKEVPVIITELEPLYAKWPSEERLSFVKNLLRSEPAH